MKYGRKVPLYQFKVVVKYQYRLSRNETELAYATNFLSAENYSRALDAVRLQYVKCDVVSIDRLLQFSSGMPADMDIRADAQQASNRSEAKRDDMRRAANRRYHGKDTAQPLSADAVKRERNRPADMRPDTIKPPKVGPTYLRW